MSNDREDSSVDTEKDNLNGKPQEYEVLRENDNVAAFRPYSSLQNLKSGTLTGDQKTLFGKEIQKSDGKKRVFGLNGILK